MWTFIRILRWSLAALPPGVVDGIGRAAGFLWFHLVPIRRRVALDNVAVALPDLSRAEHRRIVRASMQNLVVDILEIAVFTTFSHDEINARVEWEGYDRLTAAFSEGGGLIVLAGHLGNWEIEALAAGSTGLTCHVAVRVPKSKGARKLIDELRDKGNVVGVPPRGSIEKLLEGMANNDISAVVADQSQSRRRGIFVPFFGRPACTTPGPAILAERSGRPVFPVFTWRTAPQRYLVKVLPEVPLDDLRGQDDFVPKATARFNALIETMILQRPEEYLWMHRRYKVELQPDDQLHEAEDLVVHEDGSVELPARAVAS